MVFLTLPKSHSYSSLAAVREPPCHLKDLANSLRSFLSFLLMGAWTRRSGCKNFCKQSLDPLENGRCPKSFARANYCVQGCLALRKPLWMASIGSLVAISHRFLLIAAQPSYSGSYPAFYEDSSAYSSSPYGSSYDSYDASPYYPTYGLDYSSNQPIIAPTYDSGSYSSTSPYATTPSSRVYYNTDPYSPSTYPSSTNGYIPNNQYSVSTPVQQTYIPTTTSNSQGNRVDRTAVTRQRSDSDSTGYYGSFSLQGTARYGSNGSYASRNGAPSSVPPEMASPTTTGPTFYGGSTTSGSVDDVSYASTSQSPITEQSQDIPTSMNYFLDSEEVTSGRRAEIEEEVDDYDNAPFELMEPDAHYTSLYLLDRPLNVLNEETNGSSATNFILYPQAMPPPKRYAIKPIFDPIAEQEQTGIIINENIQAKGIIGGS